MKRILLALVLIILSFISFRFLSGDEDTWICSGGQWVKHGNPSLPAPAEPCPIGGDRDSYGCFIAAGFSWCEAKEMCIRPWEEYCTVTTPKKVTFVCDNGKQIEATFYPGDDKYADILFGDTKISLPRAISASGARYAKNDESLVFWNKGDTAFIEENREITYENCVLK